MRINISKTRLDIQLSTILIKLSGWYDFDGRYESAELKNISFTGDLKRYKDIQSILSMITMASGIEFSVQNNEIIAHKR